MAEHGPDMTAVLDERFAPLWVSPNALDHFRFDEAEMATNGLSSYVHPEDVGELAEAVLASHSEPGTLSPLSFRVSGPGRSSWVDCEGWMGVAGAEASDPLVIRFRIRDPSEEAQPTAVDRDPFLALTRNSSSGFALVGHRGGIGYRNPAFATYFPAERCSRIVEMPDVVSEAHHRSFRTWVDSLVDGAPEPITIALDIPGGGRRWLRLDAVPLHPENSQGMAVGLMVHDTTEQVEARESLRQIIDLVPQLIYAVDAEGRIRLANQATADFIGVRLEDLHDRRLDATPAGGPMEEILESTRDLIRSGEAVRDMEDAVTTADGTVHFLRTSLIPFRAAGSGAPALLGVSSDVTREVTSETRLSAMGHNMPDLAVIIDADGTRTFVSDSAEALLGWSPTEWSRLTDDESIHPDDLAAARATFDPARTPPGTRGRIEIRFCHRDGSWRWFEVGTVNLGNVPAVDGMLLFARDIGDRKEQDHRLRHEARHDPLSNLLNRSAVIAELELALDTARNDGTTVGVLFCDLDNFKLVNDGLGHEVGDHLLQRIALRIRHAIRDDDVVGRLGGDEFLIVARAVGGEDQLVSLADRIGRSVAEDLRTTPFPVSLSIGAALAPAGATSAGALVRDADAAMYRAKSSGKARTEVFRSDMRDRSERSLEVGRLLRSALDERRLTVHYQPVFALVDGVWRLRALEALARCPLSDGSFLAPDEFIPVAEQTGMIARLGSQVGWIVARDLGRWTATHGDDFQVWVNRSVQELDRPEFASLGAGRPGRVGPGAPPGRDRGHRVRPGLRAPHRGADPAHPGGSRREHHHR